MSAASRRRTEPPPEIPAISFSAADYREDISYPHDDPLIVSLQVGVANVKRVLIDTGSQVDLISLDVLQRMEIDASQLRPSLAPLVGLSGSERVIPEGFIILSVIFGSDPSAQASCYHIFSSRLAGLLC